MTAPASAESERFAVLRGNGRVWAVAAIHGERARLDALHGALAERIAPGDHLIYLGGFLGRGSDVAGVIESLLLFRRAIVALPGNEVDNVTFLRGAQEEIWQKLLTIPFAPNPRKVLEWMLGEGVEATLIAYGSTAKEGQLAAREGVMALTQWVKKLRDAMRARDGHNQLMSALRRAAYTEDNRLLFVHAGIDTARPLSEQTDSFWWGATPFSAITEPYQGFERIVRGFDRRRQGVGVTPHAVSLDGGCGFGGALIAAGFDSAGAIIETVEV